MTKIKGLDGFEDQFAKDVAVDPDLLKEEYAKQAADRAYYGELYVRALEAALDASGERERVEAAVWLELKGKPPEEGKKPLSDDGVKNAVRVDARVAVANKAEVRALASKERANQRLKAISEKGEMLVSLGADRRAELEGELFMKARKSHQQ